MQRRELILLLSSAAVAVPLTAGAQQKTLPVIGVLSGNGSGVFAFFRQGLREAGYFERRNLRIEYRSARGRYDELPALVAELVDRKVDRSCWVSGW
jgi:putative tryptophan/tyrosine transport system substrate-binding protein